MYLTSDFLSINIWDNSSCNLMLDKGTPVSCGILRRKLILSIISQSVSFMMPSRCTGPRITRMLRKVSINIGKNLKNHSCVVIGLGIPSHYTSSKSIMARDSHSISFTFKLTKHGWPSQHFLDWCFSFTRCIVILLENIHYIKQLTLHGMEYMVFSYAFGRTSLCRAGKENKKQWFINGIWTVYKISWWMMKETTNGCGNTILKSTPNWRFKLIWKCIPSIATDYLF